MIGDHGALRKLYRNDHEVVPGKLWRSYQPSPRDISRWADRGIKTVINLRGGKPSGFLFLEEEACAKYGLTFETFRVFSREAPSSEILHGARALFDRIAYPALIHCKSGADRAGLMATLFLFLHEGVPLDRALDQLSFRYGHIRQGKTGVIDYAFDQYLSHAKEQGLALDDLDAFFSWIDGPYNHTAMKENFMASWWGGLLSEKILRRE